MRIALIVLALIMSFALTGSSVVVLLADTCNDLPTNPIGDANGSGASDIDDTIYLIVYIFVDGPAPTPYLTASGDINCDCQVDIDDVVGSICYIFECGGPWCSCEEWVAVCGDLH